MQDKVMTEDAMAAVYVGIDVCKERLDVYLHPTARHLAVSNDPGGWRRLKRVLADHAVERVVMESTSKYHRAAHRSLSAAGLAVAVINPLRARLFAEATGTLAKTDAVDARVLALMAERLDPVAVQPLRDSVEAVQELARARRAAIDERVALVQRRSTAVSPFLRRELASRARTLDGHIARLEAELQRIIAADPVLVRRQTILCSIPGVARATAVALIASLDEIGQLGSKQASALAGLAPFAQDSGPRKRPRHIRGGRRDLRNALYMAALSAARFNPDFAAFNQRLRDNGKPPKVALIAVARKLIGLANSLVRDDRTWSPRTA
jgi:transposase